MRRTGGAFELFDETVLSLAGVDSNSHVLDLRCGNGESSRWLANTTRCAVVGIDLDRDLIEDARARSAESDLDIEFEQCSPTDLCFGDGMFSHVWCPQLHRLDDRTTVLNEIHRVLESGGVMILDGNSAMSVTSQMGFRVDPSQTSGSLVCFERV